MVFHSKQELKKSIFQKQLEKEAVRNIILLVLIGCLFFSAAIFGISYLNTQFNVREHLTFLTEVFQTACASTEGYLDDKTNGDIFSRCMKERTNGREVRYSLSKYNLNSPIPMNLVLSDEYGTIVYSSFGKDGMNLHRRAFNGIVCDNARKKPLAIYRTVYYFSGDTSEYVFSKPLYQEGKLAGFANAYLNGHDWDRLFSDYQYDSIITTASFDIIYCSREGFLPERNANKFRKENRKSMTTLHGNRYLISSHLLEEEGVFIYSFIYYPKNVLYLLIGLLTIVFLGIIWFAMTLKLSHLMAEKNARSVGMLADEMRIIRHGDSGHVIEISTGDEFEEIASQINRMVKSIHELNTRNTDLIRLNGMIEINNLQAQINPHFIYNTLDTIKYLIIPEPVKAAHLIEKFTHLLRYSINNTKQDVLLREDMKRIDDYLYIQKTRFRERFSCTAAIPEQCMDCRVPKLLLQPLIENSIKYGFKKKMEIKVAVTGWCEENYLFLRVMDDGPGVAPATLEALRAMLKSEELKTEHNGLQNLARRIVLEYGDDSEMTIDSQEGEYFQVDIKLKNMLKEKFETENHGLFQEEGETS